MGKGLRARLLDALPAPTITRISVGFGGGVGIAATVGAWILIAPQGAIAWLVVPLAGAVDVLFFGAVAAIAIANFLRRAVRVLSSPQAAARGASWPRRVATGVLAGGSAGLLLWRAGPGAVWAGVTDAVLAALPMVFLVVFGIWACLLTQRRVHASGHRWLRHSTEVLMAALVGLGLIVLFDHDLLTTEPAAGLLFPVGAWFSVRTWRAMADSQRLSVRAGADIALSLLLGTDLVLLLVWAANLLDLPETEVAVLRGTLERAGSIADLPWWLWVGLYVLLAGASLAFALWPVRLKAVAQWSGRLRVVPAVDVGRRVLTGVHIGLLVTVLIGLTTPAAVGAALRGQLKAKYTVALQREWQASGEQAAYSEILRHFAPGAAAPPPVRPLAAVVDKIHSISSPSPGGSGATSTERDLAKRLGQIQAITLPLDPPPPGLPAAPAAGQRAGFDSPVRDESDLRDRLDKVDEQDRKADAVARQVNQAAELAAIAVAGTIQIPNLGRSEIVQIIREYLSGLVESSPLKEVFAAGAKRLTAAATPPPAGEMVVPDPTRLELTASALLAGQRLKVSVAEPFTTDRALTRAESEPPADAAVDLTNEARYLDEGSGPCKECPQPLRPGDEPQGPAEHPVEPHEIP